MADRPLFWVGSSRREVRAFPEGTRKVAGFQLRRVQHGLRPNDWKPMATVGPGVEEIRVHTDVEHRVLYVATFAEGVYVLHAFEKRSRRTPRRDVDLARERLRGLIEARADAERKAGTR